MLSNHKKLDYQNLAVCGDINMNVSVIMATYKEPERLLRQAIESILEQSYKDFEYIIILDNPENKEHIRIITSYQKKDIRIRFYVNSENIGLTETLNKGIQLSRGRYICRMDADDISLPERIKRQKDYLEKGNYDLIGGRTQIIREDGTVIYSIKKVPHEYEKIKKCIVYNQVIAHPTWFGKRELFIKLNGYRNIPFCEDYDFTLRALLRNHRISNLNEIVLKYRMTSQSLSRNNLFEQYLFARYITSEYKKGRVADITRAKSYVLKRNREKTSERYQKANCLFNQLLNDLEKRRIIMFIKDGVQLAFTSLYYLNKIYRLARVSLSK